MFALRGGEHEKKATQVLTNNYMAGSCGLHNHEQKSVEAWPGRPLRTVTEFEEIRVYMVPS